MTKIEYTHKELVVEPGRFQHGLLAFRFQHENKYETNDTEYVDEPDGIDELDSLRQNGNT